MSNNLCVVVEIVNKCQIEIVENDCRRNFDMAIPTLENAF